MIRKALLSFLFLCFLLIAGDLALRIFLKIPPPQNVADRNFFATPKSLFINDSLTGFGLRPGITNVKKENGLTFTVSVDEDGYRTHFGKNSSARPKILIFGCSFFAGFGVNDTQVVSYYLQEMLPEYDVRNYSIPGHGTTTAFVRLKDLVQKEEAPAWAVVSLASFYIDRNFGASSYLNRFTAIHDYPRKFVVADFSKQNEIIFFKKEVKDNSLPFSKTSAYMHLLNSAREKREKPQQERLQLQIQLIDSIAAFCQNHGINVLYSLITKDKNSEVILQHLQAQNYNWVNSEVDYQNQKFNLWPLDGHPNAFAHQIYAREIFDFINKNDVPLFGKSAAANSKLTGK